ncbi:MAG: LLM class flavin-dependent oxidoreductase, partial [Chloroflexi bacterium]|nr:LLM class flavin-dependent oxidoreductase [Chloroflexota bacterium]
MSNPRIGAAVHEPGAAPTLALIQRAEALGIPAVWLTTGGSPDGMTAFAAAAATTRSIRMGTAIVPTFPRHPLVMAQQAVDIASLAPGRFTLGVGPSHKPAMENRYGIPFVRPLEHLREYVTILKGLLTGQQVDFDGKRFQVHARLASGADVPVIISALQAKSFELAGEIADGAVTWICPAPYLRDVALAEMQRGAAKAGRATPPMIAHAFVSVTEDRAAMVQAASVALGGYPRLPSYLGMFMAAGLTEASEGVWSERMLDAVVLQGDEV